MSASGKTSGRKAHGPTLARRLALECLEIIRERHGFAQDVIASRIDSAKGDESERSFATKLVLGVVTMQGSLDKVLDRFLKDPKGLQPQVRDALRIEAYEMLYLKKAPWACVDQGVELVRSVNPKAAGLANAVLRRIGEVAPRYPFADPRESLEAFALQQGFPLWLMQVIEEELGPEQGRVFAATSNEVPPVFISVTSPRGVEEQAAQLLEDAHGEPVAWSFENHTLSQCFQLKNRKAIADGRVVRALNRGSLVVADAASQAVAACTLPETQPCSFLEIGAGRGTKTLLIQSAAYERYGSFLSNYVTLDLHKYKSDLLLKRTQEAAIPVQEALTGDATKLSQVIGERKFDVVFIDAPCSGLGTLRRHPEIRWRLTKQEILDNGARDLKLLQQGAQVVEPGGYLIYATCTITREENITPVRQFLASEEGADFALEPLAGGSAFAPLLTPGGCDAHFAVKMRRKRPSSSS